VKFDEESFFSSLPGSFLESHLILHYISGGHFCWIWNGYEWSDNSFYQQKPGPV